MVSRKRQNFDLRFKRYAELLFGLLANGLQADAGTLVIIEIDACLLLKLFDAVIDQDFIEVSTSQIHVTVHGKHIYQAVLDVEHGHIEGSTTKVKHNDVHFFVGDVEVAGHRCGSRLIDDAHALEASDICRIPRRLFLRIIEVGRHGDDGFFDISLQPVLCYLLHGVQHLGRDLFRGPLLLNPIQFDLTTIAFTCFDLEGPFFEVLLHFRRVEILTNHPLGVVDKVFSILGSLADNDVSVRVERAPGRHCVFSQLIGKDLACAGQWVPVANATVCGS